MNDKDAMIAADKSQRRAFVSDTDGVLYNLSSQIHRHATLSEIECDATGRVQESQSADEKDEVDI